MNVLIVTALYPGYKDEPNSKIPYVVHYFAKEWINKGHDVRVINTRSRYPVIFDLFPKIKERNYLKTKYEYKNEGIKIYRVPILTYPKIGNRKRGIKKYIKYIEKVFKEEKYTPDIIVEHMITPSFILVEELKKIYKIPAILCIHKGDFVFLDNKINYKQFKKIHGYVDAYAFRNDLLFKEFKNKYSEFILNKEHFIAKSGIKSSEIIDYHEAINKNLDNKINIITVSTLIERKNIDTIIKTASRLKKKYKDLNLTIIGSGNQYQKLVKLTEQLDACEYVQFVSEISRDEVMKHIETSSIFALVSKNETLGMVYLEAMAKGCITIGSKDEGIDGIIENNINGFLCKQGDVDDLEEKIEYIINIDQKAKNKIINNAIKTINNLTEEQVSIDYIKYLDKICKLYSERSRS